MKEEEIRPKKLFDKYLSMAEKDAKRYFPARGRKSRHCPACRAEGEPVFSKMGFNYYLCDSCLTLYANPLPTEQTFRKYYSDSPSTKFWATDFYKHTEDSRRKLIFAPRAKAVSRIISRYCPTAKWVIDIGGGYGTFAEEFNKRKRQRCIVVEPNEAFFGALKGKGIKIIPKFLEDVSKKDLPAGRKCFTSFELVEHIYDPHAFFKRTLDIMEKGDILVFTTLSSTGLDLLVLWEKSNSVHPPHHINFFNPVSIRGLLSDVGFEVLEVKTPGELDIDILSNNKEMVSDRFWRYFVERCPETVKRDMQRFIKENGLSSHMRVVAKK
jgi:hypothetical protein